MSATAFCCHRSILSRYIDERNHQNDNHDVASPIDYLSLVAIIIERRCHVDDFLLLRDNLLSKTSIASTFSSISPFFG